MKIPFPAPLPLSAYQEENRQGIGEAFTEALQFLWDGNEENRPIKAHRCICYALSQTKHKFYPEAQRLLMARLLEYNVAMVCKYLQKQGYDGFDNQVIQASRKAWLTQLANEFSSPLPHTTT